MLFHHLKVMARNMIRHKSFAFLNILGLAAGMVCCILIGLWILDELSYDRFHRDASTICRVESNQNFNGRTLHIYWTPFPLGPALKAEIPEIADSARVAEMGTPLLRCRDKVFEESEVWAVDPSFLRLFTFPVVKGDPESGLSGTSSVMITESQAAQFFGDADPIGQMIHLGQTADFTVTGVLKDVPRNSSLRFDMLVPYRFLESIGATNDNFTDNQITTWVQLGPGHSATEVGAKIGGFIKQKAPRSLMVLELLPLTEVHLYTYSGYEKSLPVQSVYLFSIIAVFVLLIGCVNFMNLSTASSTRRAKEVGLRKVVGAFRSQLIRQFFGEALLYAALALGLAVTAVIAVFPAFSSLVGKDLSWRTPGAAALVLGLAGITLLVGLISASYPAFFLSSFRPVHTLKGNVESGRGAVVFRRSLVVVQFFLSAVLIIGAAVVSQQLSFIQEKDLGWSRAQVVGVPLRPQSRPRLETLKVRLADTPGVLNVALASQKPSFTSWSSSGFNWEGKDPSLKVDVTYMGADNGYVDTLGMSIVRGRNFSEDFPTDKTESFLINEELARLMGFEDPVGRSFSFWGEKGKIVGVVKDFHFQPLRRKIEPLVIRWADSRWSNYLLLRLAPGGIAGSLRAVRQTWEETVAGVPFRYEFLDDDFAALYSSERQTRTLLDIFTVMAIVVACLGLFGLASFAAERRTKEIGIRKVLGASTPGILTLLCREFLVLIALANVIAWPVGYLLARGWLDGFAYHTRIGLTVFAGAFAASLAVGLLTVLFKAARAAAANPVQALKYE
jgi:putative ABC transport system permease protein